MENKDLKKYLVKRIKQLNKEFDAEAEKDTRRRPMDYLVIGNIEGKVNAMMEVLTVVSGKAT